ncbi:MAG: SipW-dependent-type signal peptide-containing protein [Anaerovoracaceae bacterium]
MKKKITVIALVVMLLAVSVIGASLAYFTDKDSEVNTFTAGGVKIDLIEQQVNEAGTALVDFEQDQVLMPIVGSAQGEKDAFGQPLAENYIDKIVTVTNTGKSDAYVRAYFAIPSALDDGFETFNAGANILHFNFGNYFNENGGLITTYGNQWLWGTVAKEGHSGWNYFETTIDGVAYNVYFADYYQALPAGKTTEQFVSGVYLDSHVDMDAQGNYIDTRFPNADLSILNDQVKCPVFAVAVQAAGFDNAAEAVEAAFGADFNPWA